MKTNKVLRMEKLRRNSDYLLEFSREVEKFRLVSILEYLTILSAFASPSPPSKIQPQITGC